MRVLAGHGRFALGRLLVGHGYWSDLKNPTTPTAPWIVTPGNAVLTITSMPTPLMPAATAGDQTITITGYN